MVLVVGAHALWDQQVQRLSEDLRGRVPEDLRSPFIEEGDAERVVERDDGICGNRENGRDLRLGQRDGAAQRGLGWRRLGLRRLGWRVVGHEVHLGGVRNTLRLRSRDGTEQAGFDEAPPTTKVAKACADRP